MESEWSRLRIDQVAEKVAMGPFGSSIKVSTFVPIGVPVISGQHLHGTRLEDSKYNFITPEHAEKLKNANVYRGDVIFTHAGNIGQVAYIPPCSKYDRYVISQRQFFMRCNKTLIKPSFVTYYFKTHEGQHKLLANSSPSGVPSIAQPVTYLRSIEIPVPPLLVQEAIACILGAFDDKIELNRRMNRTLEEMAQAIFKSWFVDFDPVRAKADGRDTGLPSEIADLFPDGFEESEMGEIPKGWSSTSFTDSIEVIGGGTPKRSSSEYWGGSIPWFSVVDTPADGEVFAISTKQTVTQLGIDNSSARILPVGTTIISARGTVGNLALVGVPMAMNQSCYGLRDQRNLKGYFLYFATEAVVDTLRQRGHGSVFNTITRDTLHSLRVASPPDEVASAFERVVQSLMLRLLVSQQESRTLAALRDSLLPKLISGELRVPDAERIAERVV
ncbi:MAG TPA: restriction endonuclease subunit S [Lentisphaeria bacterium]|nr:MAG: EcoKI restriction-modification system protein HsdS [Lentisphaerae bacterium ADurb.Bin082]HPY90294.1 restriction endonuclease subunit S [Lentisphaeria bacterium]